jgi:hypothetical protein
VRDKRLTLVGGEEEKIPTLQSSPRGIADPGLADGPPRKLDADLLIDVLCETRAVERGGAFGAPHVRPSNQSGCEIDDILCVGV